MKTLFVIFTLMLSALFVCGNPLVEPEDDFLDGRLRDSFRDKAIDDAKYLNEIPKGPEILKKNENAEVLDDNEDPEVLNDNEDPEVLNDNEDPEVLDDNEDPEVLNDNEDLEVLDDNEDPEEEVLHKKDNVQEGPGNISKKWPNNKVVYKIPKGEFTNIQINVINDAIKTIEKNTCIKFVEKRPSDKNYVSIERSKSCSSSVGFQGRKQVLELDPSICINHRGILHEFMHALGFHHMHNHPNRNDYVTIKWENIKKAKRHNFEIEAELKYRDFGVPYDYLSVTHYSKNAFSINNKPTIIPKKNFPIGTLQTLSKGDITKLNALYNCGKH